MNIRNKLINANENELYKIIKENYKFNSAECSITKIPIETFDNFKYLLNKDAYFDWDFCKNYANKCKLSYHINYKNVNFFILSDKNITNKSKSHLFNCIYRVYLVKHLYNIKPEQYINYYILLNPLKRRLPNRKVDIVKTENINGGFTYINANNIYIVRKEDYEKVALHELLHHCDIIHNENWKPKNINVLKNLCKIEQTQDFVPNEAIIETFAIILNVVFKSIENNVSFKSILAKDREHSIVIAKKIIEKQDNKLWKENSHSYCYIVLRAVFYIYFKEFIKSYSITNDDEVTLFICKYFPKIIKKLEKIKDIKGDKSIKQTIFSNF